MHSKVVALTSPLKSSAWKVGSDLEVPGGGASALDIAVGGFGSTGIGSAFRGEPEAESPVAWREARSSAEEKAFTSRL